MASSGGRAAAAAARSAKERAYAMLDDTARIRMHELKDNPGARTAGRLGNKGTNQAGHTQGALEHAAKPPLGWIWGDFFRPWHRMFPGERKFNSQHNLRRPMRPLSLIELARLIDLGWIDPSRPIDLPALLSTGKLGITDEVGIMLTSEGASSWVADVELEVQSACQQTIAAVEKAGGSIRVAYYDPISIKCASSAERWFSRGEPIPVRRTPPVSLLDSYSLPANRGYLAPQADIERERQQLAQVMGYEYQPERPRERKDAGQVFYGLPAGGVVSLVDKKVFAPSHPSLQRYYQQEQPLGIAHPAL